MADAVTISRPSTGGGSGNWTDDIEEATLDGEIALKVQDASPSATADYAKIYSKSAGEQSDLLFDFDNDTGLQVTDSSGNTNHGTPSTLGSYVTSLAGSASGTGAGGSGFGDAPTLDGSNSYIAFPSLGIGTGDLTIEFWASFDDAAATSTVFNLGTTISIAGQPNLGVYNPNKVWLSDGTNIIEWTINWYNDDDGGNNAWRHWVLTRTADGVTGNSQWALYFSGVKQSIASGAGTPLGYWATSNITGSGEIGRRPTGQYMDGKIDGFAVYKNATVYTGSSFTVPVYPTGLPGTKLYAMDGTGAELRLTP